MPNRDSIIGGVPRSRRGTQRKYLHLHHQNGGTGVESVPVGVGAAGGPPGLAIEAGVRLGDALIKKFMNSSGTSGQDRQLARSLAQQERRLARQKLLIEILRGDTATVAENERAQQQRDVFGPRLQQSFLNRGQGSPATASRVQGMDQLVQNNFAEFQAARQQQGQAAAASVPLQAPQQQTVLEATAQTNPALLDLLQGRTRDVTPRDQAGSFLEIGRESGQRGTTGPQERLTIEDIERALSGRNG
jgi:hypothetical protein